MRDVKIDIWGQIVKKNENGVQEDKIVHENCTD